MPDEPARPRRRIWPVVQRVWITLGISATVIFTGWSLIAYRASPGAHAALASDVEVEVTRREGAWWFEPRRGASAEVGLMFFPGALVNPVAYAPLAREVARAGYRTVILELPRRGAFGGADDPALYERARVIGRSTDPPERWVLGGHSRGGVVTSTLASSGFGALGGVVLIGTSHPRDVDLSALRVPVVKIVGTRDGLASMEEVEANRRLLPETTTWIRVEGGNHSQFGWYGFQPGDRRARISAEAQRAEMVRGVLAAMRASELFEQ